MKRWICSGIVIVGGAMVIACGDQRSDAPAGPVASVTALTSVPVCDLSQTSSLVAQYFNATDARTARGLIDQMAAAGAGTVAARDRGFDLIALIARNAQAGTGGAASNGSDLINKVTPCMFQNLAELPETFPEDYTIAITTAAAGGLGVRGGATDNTSDPVVSRDGFSRVAPKSGATWSSTLNDSNPAPARVAFYGRPGSTASSYDWKVLPRNAKFRPPVVIGLCVSSESFPTTMLHEEHVGLLAFEEVLFVDPANCRVVASRGAFSAITSQLAGLFLPQRLTAAAITKGVGGSSGGIGSEFSPNAVPNVSLAFTATGQPPTTVTVGDTFSVQLRATDPVTRAAVPGTMISIVAVNNNGTRKLLKGTTTPTTNNAGVATFSGLSFDPNSTGGFRLVVGGNVVGRDSIKVGQATSNKVNVKPK